MILTDGDDNTILEVDGATFSWKDEEGFTNISSSNKQGEDGDKDFELVNPFSLKDLTIFIEKVMICLYFNSTMKPCYIQSLKMVIVRCN